MNDYSIVQHETVVLVSTQQGAGGLCISTTISIVSFLYRYINAHLYARPQSPFLISSIDKLLPAGMFLPHNLHRQT
jgi:hypothetical protein